MSNVNNDRRKFLRGAGVAATAVAAGSTAAASEVDSLQHKLGVLEDGNAIRALQRRLVAALQQQDDAQLAALFVHSDAAVPAHEARLLDARLDGESIDLAPDRRSARAQLHARVQLALPLAGNGTLQQMARLQGSAERRWTERGVYTMSFVKTGTEWKVLALDYATA